MTSTQPSILIPNAIRYPDRIEINCLAIPTGKNASRSNSDLLEQYTAAARLPVQWIARKPAIIHQHTGRRVVRTGVRFSIAAEARKRLIDLGLYAIEDEHKIKTKPAGKTNLIALPCLRCTLDEVQRHVETVIDEIGANLDEHVASLKQTDVFAHVPMSFKLIEIAEDSWL